ncbi:hypothetical protein ACWD4J_30190 [Streptomyces sp. NPDC002577]
MDLTARAGLSLLACSDKPGTCPANALSLLASWEATTNRLESAAPDPT